MNVETVKVYKGKSVVICNKTDVEEWNENGYFTSSQQKKKAKGWKEPEPEVEEPEPDQEETENAAEVE